MLSEKNLINRLKKHDEEAFNELYHTYIGLVKHVVGNMVLDHNEIDDICQITFIKLYDNIANFKGGNLKYYLLQIAKNEARQYLRKQNYEQKFLNETAYLGSNNIVPFSDSVWENVAKILTKEEYNIFVLHFIYGFNFKELAIETKCSKTGCYNIYKQALNKVKIYLKGDEKNETKGFKK